MNKFHIFFCAVTHLLIERRQKLIHCFEFVRRTRLGSYPVARKHINTVIQCKLKEFRRIVPSVRPRRLFALNEVFNTAYHAVVSAILKRIAVSFKCGNICLIVHHCRVTESRADDLKAGIDKFRVRIFAYSCREIRSRYMAIVYRIENNIRKLIYRIASVLGLNAAYCNICHIVTAQKLRMLMQLIKSAGNNIFGIILCQSARLNIGLIIRIQILIHTSESHCISLFVYEQYI